MKNLLQFCLTLVIIHCSVLSFAQYDPSKINKKAREAYNKGMAKIEEDNFKDATAFFEQAIKTDPNYVDAYLSLAGVFGELKNLQQSISYYEKAFALDSNYTSELRLPYAINLARLGQFEKALNAVNGLLSKEKINPNTKKAAEYRRRSFEFAVAFERSGKAKNYVFEPKNLGEGVNTSESEYFPSQPIEGRELIFTRRLNGFNEDFFLSRTDGQKWESSYRLNGSINTDQNEGAQIISQDGQWLVFTGCNRPNGAGSCDIYISYVTPQGWSEAINLGNKINTEEWESQPCLSPDKRDLYFASRRPGGFGGSDLYVSHLGPNGRWTEPENLGADINTAGDEQSPFIHADNQTLYFASNGLLGYGDDDLFVIRKDSTGKWGKPENLGYPINTPDREGTLFIAANGKTAYYASERSDTKGKLDIYSFELREDVRPHKTLWIKGKVYDQKTMAGLPSAVELIDLTTKLPVSKVQTDEKGLYLITLPVGKNYAFNVARKGYLFYSDNFSLTNKSPDSTYEKNIPLQPIELNAAVVLRNIFFDYNKYELKTASEAELDRVIQLLNDNPAVKIQIAGHTDNIGNATENLKLSENRAKSVINYLVKNGIDAKRLSSKGFGATQPVADNKTEETRAMNRRTELKIVGK